MPDNVKLYYKTCREQAGLTQEQAVVLLGISEVSTLSKYENGKLPVSSALAAEMVKVYRVPSLAIWHLKYANPELARYLPEVSSLVTDGDMALQMELADDDISDVRKSVKSILRDGAVSGEESVQLKENAAYLRESANKLLSAAVFLEEREADEKPKQPN